MAINYTRSYGSTGAPTSGWTSGTIAPAVTTSTANYAQIKASLPPGATESDIIREATRLGVLPPAPVLTGMATPEQLQATEDRFRQITAFLPNGQSRFRSGSASRAVASPGSSNPRSGGGNARSGMGVAEGRQGTAIAQGRGSAAPVSSGWTAGSVAPQLQFAPAPTAGIPIGQAMLTPPRYPGDVPSWLPQRVQELNSGQNFRGSLMDLLFSQSGGNMGVGMRPSIDPAVAAGYAAAAQSAAALQQAQTRALGQPQRIQDELAYWQGQQQAFTQPGFTAAGSPVNPEVLRINAQIAALQQQLRGAQPLAQRAAGASSGWTPAVLPRY